MLPDTQDSQRLTSGSFCDLIIAAALSGDEAAAFHFQQVLVLLKGVADTCPPSLLATLRKSGKISLFHDGTGMRIYARDRLVVVETITISDRVTIEIEQIGKGQRQASVAYINSSVDNFEIATSRISRAWRRIQLAAHTGADRIDAISS